MNDIREFSGKYGDFKENNGIVYGFFKTEMIDLDISKEMIKSRLEFTNFEDSLMFIDATKVKTISKQARDYFGSIEGTDKLIAVALFTNSKLSVFLANFFVKVNLSSFAIPIKLFSDEKKAVMWLEKFKK